MESKKIRKRVLFLIDGAYPPTSGSAVIMDNLLSGLVEYDVILVGEQSYNTKIEEWRSPSYLLYLIKHKFEFGVKGSRFFKWINYFYIKRRVLSIAVKHQVDIIVGVYPNEFYQLIGAQIALKLKKPFYSWFHNTYFDNRVGVLKFFAYFIQDYIFRSSRIIFTMSEGMNEYMSFRYPNYINKFKPLLHSFIIPKISSNMELRRGEKGIIRFLLSGELNHSNIDATSRLCKVIIANPGNELYIYSKTPESEYKKVEIYGKNVFFEKFLPLEEFVSKFELYDILLLPHGFQGKFSKAEYQTIFPTRVIPLLYSKKPILAHSPKNVTLTNFLKKYNCAKVITNTDVVEIKNEIERFVFDINEQKTLVLNAIDTSKLFDIERNVEIFRTCIEDNISEKC